MNTQTTNAATTSSYNSTANQQIKETFVGREVYVNVNSMVEYILQKSWEDSNAPFSYDSITNFYSYTEYYGEFANFEGGSEEDRQTEIDRLSQLIDDITTSTGNDDITEEQTAIQAEIDTLEELEKTEQAEIFEYWAVSGWLCEKLKLHNACVIEDENIWCRTTSGQAILLDAVISKICEGLEILEGQANDWSK